MEPSTKKGLIIGGSIAAVVLIGASVGIGIAASGGSSSSLINPDENIEVWGYNDQVSSTSLKVNKYMGLTFNEEAGYWDSSEFEASAEGTLLNNSHYHSVNDDSEILDGVHGAAAGLGYLSSTWVGGYVDNKGNGDQFTMLKLYDNGVVDGVAPTTEPERTDAANYLDPTDDADKQAYSEVNSISEELVGDNGTYSLYSEAMQATMNTTMKVPPTIAEWVRTNLGTDAPLEVAAGSDEEVFTMWLGENGFIDDFTVAYGLFNYMAFDGTNIENINTIAIPGSNDTGTIELEDGWYDAALQPTYENLMMTYDTALAAEDISLVDDVYNQQKATSGAYAIKVDGTGTNSGIMKQEISNYQDDFRTASGNSKIVFKYDLNNGGSGQAWAKTKEGISYDGTTLLEADADGAGRADAFIGTSSRASKISEVANFGYEEDAATLPNGGEGDFYVSPETSATGQILGYTMGIDLPVFFINNGMKFEHTVTETSLLCIENATEKGIQVGDTVTVTPTGMSDQGGKAIYEDQATWTDVLNQGLIIVEAV